MITLGQIKTEIAFNVANIGIGSRIGNWVQWICEDIVAGRDYWWNKKKASFTTTNGTAEYFLSHRVQGKQVSYMGDESNQSWHIKEVPLEAIYRFDSTPTETGTPINWAYVEESSAQASNASGTSTAVSSSASDLSIIVTVRGKVSGIERFEALTLNGTNTVTPASALTWDDDTVISVNLSQACTGVVTVTVGGTTVASIPPGLLRVQCPRIRLWRVPDSTLTIPYVYYQNFIPPVSDNDIIDLPNMAWKALMLGVEWLGHKNNGSINAAEAISQDYERAKLKLFSDSTRELDQVIKKDFGSCNRGVVFVYPRIIDGTVQ